jgi:N-acyl-D-glutamate deacylase
VWPLPGDAVAHPRSAATFARFFAQYVTRRRLIALPDAVAKCTLIPAQILATASAAMSRKGRLQVGADADVTVFNLAAFQDQATFTEPTHPSVGVLHLLVGGTALIRDGILDTAARPGSPVRATVGPRR